ncbi:MAG TPA: Gfo/Idh/MocA family oxidoreductase, partial [Edaphobacter sp.]|nr:Gfo/Idh/MocA family oxidoreductase [Edaphobacter sp.]
GPGWIGEVQLRKLLKRSDVWIAAVHSSNQERTSALLHDLELDESLYQPSYQRMLEQPEIKSIWLASPNALHGPQAIAALRAGKHLFCEKPVAITYRDQLTLYELSRQNPHLISFVDYVLYFNPMEQKLMEMVRTGLLGELTQVQVNYRHPINISDRRAWKLHKDVMGDAISMGINHAVSVITWIFAANGQHPIAVYATSEKARIRPFEPDAIWNITIHFSGGGTAFCFGNIDFNNGYDAYHNVTGTKGAFVFDAVQPLSNKVRYSSQDLARGQWIWPLDTEQCAARGLSAFAWPPTLTLPDSGNVLDHGLDDAIDCYIESVKTSTSSPLSIIHSAAITEISWAAQLSAATGKRISLPLDTESALKILA